ncbi:hypothetical protein BRADI_1g52643v3 [Brachypodium distachyon]|uniref:Uncharacterized protein n=1 Tax=Brachypodium distachyon TaxID=15368 RepID=A0A0Q3HB35_BRADI|nr:hypothetical protein BRADI_1g52643v3 [Brachypodium distachyon]
MHVAKSNPHLSSLPFIQKSFASISKCKIMKERRQGETAGPTSPFAEVWRCHHHHCGNGCGYCLRRPHSDPSLLPSLFIFQVICFLLVFRLFGFPRAANMELSAPSPSTR